MLIVDRAVAADPHGGRMRRLLSGLDQVPEELTMAPTDPEGRRRAIAEAVSRREAVYLVDNLRLGVEVVTRRPGARLVVDLGDEVSSLASARGGNVAEVGGLFAAQRVVEYRARGVVVRGVGHAGALASRPWHPPCSVVPDVAVVPTEWEARPRSGPGLTIGFVGTSHLSRRAPPAGWEVPELLKLLPRARAIAVLDGSGADQIRRRAEELGVAARLEVRGPVTADRLGPVLAGVDVCVSTQTANLAGHVRTTGKLVEYLALGKVVVASRVGTAAAVLPPFLTVDRDDVYSDTYIEAVAERIGRLAAVTDAQFLDLQRYNRRLATTLFSPAALAPVWLEKMREWEVVSR